MVGKEEACAVLRRGPTRALVGIFFVKQYFYCSNNNFRKKYQTVRCIVPYSEYMGWDKTIAGNKPQHRVITCSICGYNLKFSCSLLKN